MWRHQEVAGGSGALGERGRASMMQIFSFFFFKISIGWLELSTGFGLGVLVLLQATHGATAG